MTTPHPLPTSSLHHDTDAHLPAAAYLRYESRADGWSAGRQAAFLAHLADHGVVADAAKIVGMSLGGGYALRRQARGFAFGLGWEAALLLARRIVADRLMAAAIQGEEARWVREDGVTTYTRQNTRLSLALLDRVTPAATLPEVTAVMHRFDWFLELIDKAASAQQLWDLFFDDALTRDDAQARARVRGALLLCEESAVFEEETDGEDEDGYSLDDDYAGMYDDEEEDEEAEDEEKATEPPIEYKSMDGPPRRQTVVMPRRIRHDGHQTATALGVRDDAEVESSIFGGLRGGGAGDARVGGSRGARG